MKFAPGMISARIGYAMVSPRGEASRSAAGVSNSRSVKDVSPVGIGRELDLIHREKVGLALARHRFDGAHLVRGPRA